ncbi:Ig-like domain (group 2) [Mariniphaga anaerophila]|uniref:Ig-like domain (Group 2) n=1 Tax=Mariniphaga anaerophila TaxID=1484053 RepID=A0A1M5GKI4_9BACT|nr:Ig-like domain-containing protein [Mariniphaga anaerophila]SHG04031.1 Ig-like domain (group 2) [Mariniphaga anaerophila]
MKKVCFLALVTYLVVTTACDKEDVALTDLYLYIPTNGNTLIQEPATLMLEIGDKETLIAFAEPDNATNKELLWSSDTPPVATVNDNGEVVAITTGMANITVSTNDGRYSKTCHIFVIPAGPKRMTLTKGINYDNVSLLVSGRGTFTIDWGDGSIIETDSSDWGLQVHSYSDRSSRTINIIGGNVSTLSCESDIIDFDLSNNIALTNLGCNLNVLTSLDVSKNIWLYSLSCNYNHLTSLDLSNNVNLTWLDCCVNKLTSLDVSKNIALTSLKCNTNNLKTNDLEALFETLNTNAGTKKIYIGGNPGTEACDRGIATNKGWIVSDWK